MPLLTEFICPIKRIRSPEFGIYPSKPVVIHAGWGFVTNVSIVVLVLDMPIGPHSTGEKAFINT